MQFLRAVEKQPSRRVFMELLHPHMMAIFVVIVILYGDHKPSQFIPQDPALSNMK